MGTPGAPAPRPHTAPDRAVPLPIGTRVMRIPVEPWPAARRRRPPLRGTVMSHAAAYARGRFSVRWDDGIWEAQLDVGDVTAVEEEATVIPLSSRPRPRAVS